MPAAERLTNTFNEDPSHYNKWRPGYPNALFADIFAAKQIGPGSRVLEVGIGTGQATLPFLETGCRLTAVEKGDNLAAFAREKFAGFSELDIVNLPFQAYQPNEGRFDLIYSASAFHWLPEEEGYKKVFALLKKGGVFARFANHPHFHEDYENVHRALQEVYQKHMPGSKPKPRYTAAHAQERCEIARKYGFVSLSCQIYLRTRIYTAEDYVALLDTYSDHRILEEKKKIFFEDIRNAINKNGGFMGLLDTLDLALGVKP